MIIITHHFLQISVNKTHTVCTHVAVCEAISLVVLFLEYHFVSREEMQSKVDNGHFIEHAVFSGNMYGTR